MEHMWPTFMEQHEGQISSKIYKTQIEKFIHTLVQSK